MRLRSFISACLTAAVLLLPGAVSAQTSSSSQPPRPDAAAKAAAAAGQPATPRRERRAKWEIELHGGLSLDPDHSAGTGTLPTTGSTVGGLLSFNTFTFGSATQLYNAARPGSPITALDPVLNSSMFTRTAGQALGGRLFRALTPRLGLEFAGEYLHGNTAFRPSALSALEATRASVASSLQQTLAATGQTASASATTAITDKQLATRVLATAGLVVNLSKSQRTTPYFVAGGGLVFTHDTQLAAQFDAQYSVGSASYLTGYDHVWVHMQEDSRKYMGFAGAGVKQALTKHIGIQADGRLHLYPASTITLVSTTPGMAPGSTGPTLPVFNFANGLQFSGISPLSGPALVGAQSFAGSGLQPHLSFTAGVFLRF